MYFESLKIDEDEPDEIRIEWILGRPLKCTFYQNLVYVGGYNFEHEDGLAQKAISTCPNIEKKKTL